MPSDSGKDVIFGGLLGCLIGGAAMFVAGTWLGQYRTREGMQSEAVNRGAAEYDRETGNWRWKQPLSRPVSKSKPLSERVEWIDDYGAKWWDAELGGIGVEVRTSNTRGTKYQGRCYFAWRGWRNLKAKTERAAKAEALRIVQRAIQQAAEAWAD